MNMYVAMMAAVLILAYLMRGDRPENKSYIWLSCFLMFALMGFRDITAIGNDSATSYLNNFAELTEQSWESILERFRDGEPNPGLSVSMKLFSDLLGPDYQAFTILYIGFNLTVFGWFIQKYSVNPVQSFVYYWGLIFYTFMADIMKQGVAMTFLLLAFDAIVQRKPIRFTLLVYVAYLFHAPALVFLPAYLISKLRTNRSYLIFLAAMLATVYLFREPILELMLQFYETDIHDASIRFLANKVLIMLVIVAVALVLRPPEEGDRIYCILLQFMGISIVLQTFAGYNNTFERLANYYFQFCVVFIPLVFQPDARRSQLLDIKTEAMVKQAAPWAFGAFGVWRFAGYITANAWAWLPYRFFFE